MRIIRYRLRGFVLGFVGIFAVFVAFNSAGFSAQDWIGVAVMGLLLLLIGAWNWTWRLEATPYALAKATLFGRKEIVWSSAKPARTAIRFPTVSAPGLAGRTIIIETASQKLSFRIPMKAGFPGDDIEWLVKQIWTRNGFDAEAQAVVAEDFPHLQGLQ